MPFKQNMQCDGFLVFSLSHSAHIYHVMSHDQTFCRLPLVKDVIFVCEKSESGDGVYDLLFYLLFYKCCVTI